MKREITIKQKKFADLYIETGNGTQSYIDAGYSINGKRTTAEANSKRLLRNDIVRNYIDERLKELDSKKIADQNEVLEYLTKVMRGEEKDQFGLDATLQDRTKCAELLGKRYGTWVEKKEINGNLKTEIKVELEDD